MSFPRPAWMDLPPEQWPPDAREFYRLAYAIMHRTMAAEPHTPNAGSTRTCRSGPSKSLAPNPRIKR